MAQTHTRSQIYLSTRCGDYGVSLPNIRYIYLLANPSKLSFETVVLKGLATDGGLFLPEEVPVIAD